MDPRTRRRALEAAVRAHPLVQWGQDESGSVLHDGHSTGCGHVEWQRAIYLWTGKRVTIDEISRHAGYSVAQRNRLEGLTAVQVRRIIGHYDLPYTGPQYHGDPSGILEALRDRGPALLAVGYFAYPQWEDAKHYSGGKPTGSPNGYAFSGGRNDLGFIGGHMVTALAVRFNAALKQNRVRVCDPDHGSVLRPEIPPFDIIRGAQFRELVNSGKHQFGAVVAYLPDREWTGVPA